MSEGKIRKSLGTTIGKLGWLALLLGAVRPVRWLLEIISDVLTLKTISPSISSFFNRLFAVIEHPAFSLVCLAAGVIMILRSMQHGRNSEVPSSPPTEAGPLTPIPLEDRRIFLGLGVTPEFLRKLCEGKMDVEAKRIVEPYIGKWLTVNGEVSNVYSGEDGTSAVTFSSSFIGMADVWMWFDAVWEQGIEILTKGQEIRVRGRITKISGTELVLHDCELAEP